MTLAMFPLGSLTLLDQLDSSITPENKKDWIEWIYAQQLLPTGQEPDANETVCGFRGSSWSGRPFDPTAVSSNLYPSNTIDSTLLNSQQVISVITTRVILQTHIQLY